MQIEIKNFFVLCFFQENSGQIYTVLQLIVSGDQQSLSLRDSKNVFTSFDCQIDPKECSKKNNNYPKPLYTKAAPGSIAMPYFYSYPPHLVQWPEKKDR